MLKRIVSHIPGYIRLLSLIYIFNLLVFLLFRILFSLMNRPSLEPDVHALYTDRAGSLSPAHNSQDTFSAFCRGWEFDTAVLCWILALPFLLWTLVYFFPKSLRVFDTLGYGLLIAALLIAYLVCSADIPYYAQFGSHLNKNAMLWNDSPGFVLGMIFGSFSHWGYLFLFVFMSIPSLWFMNKMFRRSKQEMFAPSQKKVKGVLASIIVLALIIAGARGRVMDRSPLHEGLAIVSADAFTNQIAINPNFTFWRSLLFAKEKAYHVPGNIQNDITYTRRCLGIKGEGNDIRRMHFVANDSTPAYNVVIVVMESMCTFKMGYYGGKDLTPNLHRLNKESVFCENFFSSGIHTYNGLFSTISGYPGILTEQGLRSYVKAPFPGIGTLLKEKGYDTFFYTTHDPHFDNMEGFFRINGFDHFISEYDFSTGQSISSLGVPDHVLFDKLIETHSTVKNKPFLSVVMTASDHGPWHIPSDIPFKPKGANEKENCTLYADWAIGRFMDQAKQQAWYKNTVFIFLGDHGLSMGHTYDMPISFHHIPCIIHQPGSLKPDTISSPCYQPDIPATVMGLLNRPFVNETFGIDIFREKHPFVIFSADDKLGCVTDKGDYYYRLLSSDATYLRKYKTLDPVNYVKIQKELADSLDAGMNHIFEAARYFIRRDHYLYE